VRQEQKHIEIATRGQGLYEFTPEVAAFVAATGFETGQVTVYIRHTSASLLIQENADGDVQRDLAEFFARLVPENMDWLRHTAEGPDDMPAHIKGALTQTALTIPISGGAMALGTWQGIFLFEHRSRPHERGIVLHAIGV
jgi:secondary thiamine-phosphate synthase enzyme